jgi:shikimate kinase
MDTEGPIVLVGMMGSGKTFVGRALARATGRRYVDNDELVEQATGFTSRELLRRGGTPAVLAAEAEALRRGLAEPGGPIVGVAAGTILDPELRALLRQDGVRVVWLQARPETLARRVLAVDDSPAGEHRPWHAAGQMTPQEWLARESERRAPLYREVADLEVRVDDDQGRDRPADEIVEEIIAGLGLQRASS